MSTQPKSSLLETIAIVVSASIVLTAIVYWIVQIEGAREMLKQAYPGG
jgi:hypothetical protein